MPLATAQITVRGTTLTINGRHTIATLTIERNASNQPGILTHSQGTTWDYSGNETDIVEGLYLIINSNVSIQGPSVMPPLQGSRIDVNARGGLGFVGLGAGGSAQGFSGGGAGYGGAGSDSQGSSQATQSPGGLGGFCYPYFSVNVDSPNLLGSGGGNGWLGGTMDANSGGAGGGAIRLEVNGTLTVDGQIIAGGANGFRALNNGSGTNGGGGSGGSIYLTCNTIAGSGTISANGGNGGSDCCQGVGGGGGGGRIAIRYTSGSLTGITRRATGGTGANSLRGGAGTIYTKLASDVRGTLTIDNDNVAGGETTEFYGQVTLNADVVVKNLGRLGPAHGSALDIEVSGNVHVMANGSILADYRGLPGSMGDGQGGSAQGFSGGGAGYGGAGSDGQGSSQATQTPGGLGGFCYPYFSVNVESPILLGSGGGNGWLGGTIDPNNGGAGGGAIRLTVNGTLTVDGQITTGGANGFRAFDNGSGTNGGGGSGGSIYLTCNAIAGSGTLAANGGNGGSGCCQAVGGGGGGGRVAIYYTTGSVASITMSAVGGTGADSRRGGAGTIYVKRAVDPRGTIFVDNGNVANGETTEFYGPTSLNADIVIRNLGRLGPPHPAPNSPSAADGILELTINGNMQVTSSGSIYAIGRGFAGSTGSGQGWSAQGLNGGGGAYGGSGGVGQPSAPGGSTNGSVLDPSDLGSGGGNGWLSGTIDPNSGGAGGGAIRLTVNGALTVDGQITATGANGFRAYDNGSGTNGGGGSGGSIHLSCNAISGTGTLSANGGSGGSGCCQGLGGGGGGGRIEINAPCDASPMPVIQVLGGTGFQAGAIGTVWRTQTWIGDINGDSLVNIVDVENFVNILLGYDSNLCHFGTADVNRDGSANGLDVAPFLAMVLGEP